MVSLRAFSFLVLLGAIIFVLYRNALQPRKFLLIGILSAPEHFELRNAIRNTWLQNLPNDVIYYFLVGKHLCNVPVEDRISELACEESALSLPPDSEKLIESGSLTCNDTEVPLYSGYTFTVQHDIIIQRIGILNDLCEEKVEVHLVEAATGSKITSASFLSSEDRLHASSHVAWKAVERYRLPKGFEGNIVFEQEMKTDYQHWNCGFNWKSNGNVLNIHLLLTPQGHAVKFHENSLSPVVFGFELADVSILSEFLAQKSARRIQRRKKTSMILQKLQDEFQKEQDILFLNVMDVYRSLPKKMLRFYEWAHKNEVFSYLLKTDDDTFINVPLVMKELQHQSSRNKESSKDIWWWSSFRESWPVQLFGKWREISYPSLNYPSFPCGAGYVLSQGTVNFLSSIADKLFSGYQGEDVALGIWLAGTNPQRILNRTTCLWTCSTPSIGNFCNYPQISAREMYKIYQQQSQLNQNLTAFTDTESNTNVYIDV